MFIQNTGKISFPATDTMRNFSLMEIGMYSIDSTRRFVFDKINEELLPQTKLIKINSQILKNKNPIFSDIKLQKYNWIFTITHRLENINQNYLAPIEKSKNK